MKVIILLALFAVNAYCVPAMDMDIIHAVNQQKTTWTAGVNRNFLSYTKEDVKKLMGWTMNPPKKIPIIEHPVGASLPDNWSADKQWPKCPTISTIYDQAECGSCWAFGCVEAVQDRFCIQGWVNLTLSFEDEVCCDQSDGGCQGGEAESAWQNVQSNGLVTAGCAPYTVPTCPPAQEPCLNFVDTPDCPSSCSDGENWQSSKHFTTSTYGVSSDPTQIQQEMFSNGPVEACFSVYADFVTYKSGVYQYTTGDFLGGHCVKCIGWGVENGTPYWLCNNSWTTYWGDKGQFKILRGSDECGIEDEVVAGAAPQPSSISVVS